LRLAGIHKNSFVDYPGHIAAVLFTRGCNLNCWYCHNRHIIEKAGETASVPNVLSFLSERSGFLDSVVLTGGEPLLQEDVLDFMRTLKGTGLLVKLDTNGTNPKTLSTILKEGLADYVAMDIKAPYAKYDLITPIDDIADIALSAKIIMDGKADYEFRTTFAPNLSAEDIGDIAKSIAGARKYCIQQFKKSEGMAAKIAPEPHKVAEIRRAEALARQYVDNVAVRGAY
jgi:pyruvate formate lyase activating enzyme